MNEITELPKLIEPGMKKVLKKALNRVHVFNNENYNYYFNIGLLMLLIVLIYLLLMSRYKGNISKEEILERNRLKKEYIVKKLMLYSGMKENRKEQKNLITDLPLWDNHPEKKNLDMKNINIDYNNGR